jgi:antirestriction protein
MGFRFPAKGARLNRNDKEAITMYNLSDSRDCAFEAFVTNLGKYNEGELVGEWVKFPISNEEMQEVFKRIGINRRYEEWFITDYDCPDPGIYDLLGEYESLSELNYLANQIMELDESEEFWQAVLDLGEYTGSVQDLINLTENMDCFDYLSGVTSDSDLGYYWIEESGCYDTKALGVLSNYIDYEGFGRDIRFEESGTYTDHGYVRLNGSRFVDVYDGEIEHIPDEYRIQSPNAFSRVGAVKSEQNQEFAR